MRIPKVTPLYVAEFLARIPMLGISLALTLLVVQVHHRGYAEAGLVAAAETVGAGVGGPWRGRALDAVGLRRTVAPSVIAAAIVFPLMTIAPYLALLPLAFVAGLALSPFYSLSRVALGALVPADQQRTAFAFDNVIAEMSFIIGPAIAGVLATQVGARPATNVIGGCVAAGGALIWWLDPPTRSPAVVVDVAAESTDATPHPARNTWLTADICFLYLVGAGSMVALMATDLGIIAALREKDAVDLVGITYLGWAGASLVGGLAYGAMHRSLRPTHLLLAMGLLTLPIGFAHTPWLLAAATIPAGALCAPVLAATSEHVTSLVDEARRGEAMGWLSTSYTFGGAAATPLVGWAIDRTDAWGGFVLGGVIATAIALASLGGQLLHRR